MALSSESKTWRETAIVRRWHRRKAAGRIEEMVISPGDLRTPEGGFVEELLSGSIGLAGCTATFGASTPFAAAAPSLAFARELHGFGWLRHLEASRTAEAEAMALALLVGWIEAGGRAQSIACEPAVTARRVISWLSHSATALHGAPLANYDAVMDALAEDISWLRRKAAQLPADRDRLLCGLASLEAAICCAEDATVISALETAFLADLTSQFRADGVHVSRTPSVALDLLLDLVPLRQLYQARQRALPDALPQTIDRMLLALARLRLGNGSIAHVNGMGATVIEHVSVLLGGSGSGMGHGSGVLADAGYARMESGKTIVLMDVGAPPPAPWLSPLHAGLLSFEMSLARAPLICNSAIAFDGDAMVPAAPSGNHSTLYLDHALPLEASASLARSDVGGSFSEDANETVVEAFHAGWRRRFGLLHQRRLALSRDGRRLGGHDRLAGTPASLAQPHVACLYFRLHPSVRVELVPGGEVRLTAANGMRARFKAEAGITSIEPATFHGGQTKSLATMAIVVHADIALAPEISWHIAVTN